MTLGVGAAGVTNLVDVDGDQTPALLELLDVSDPLVGDSDTDGLPDSRERDHGTNPRVADTDGDGLADATEVTAAGSDPRAADTDDDGLGDAREWDLGTDRTSVDTDGDGLRDQRETERGTDPTAKHSDDDGLSDGVEVADVGSSPLVADTDVDGLADDTEYRELETNATLTDTDDDTLADGREQELGTDPTKGDTDTDGLWDRYEVATSGPLGAADPLRRDVFLELDYMKGEKPDPGAIASVKEAYANAPVENPDGTTGITLHVVVDDEVRHENTTTGRDRDVLMYKHFDHPNQGYHYAVAVDDARTKDGRNVAGLATSAAENGQFIFETDNPSGGDYRRNVQASLFMHELGHSVGLVPHAFAGIDSYDYAYERYPSVMNYNAPEDALTYSKGSAFDDWAYLESNLYAPIVKPDAVNTTTEGS